MPTKRTNDKTDLPLSTPQSTPQKYTFQFWSTGSDVVSLYRLASALAVAPFFPAGERESQPMVQALMMGTNFDNLEIKLNLNGSPVGLRFRSSDDAEYRAGSCAVVRTKHVRHVPRGQQGVNQQF